MALLLIATSAAAQPPADCKQLETDCDAAILALKNEVKQQNDIITALTQQRNDAIKNGDNLNLKTTIEVSIVGGAITVIALALGGHLK